MSPGFVWSGHDETLQKGMLVSCLGAGVGQAYRCGDEQGSSCRNGGQGKGEDVVPARQVEGNARIAEPTRAPNVPSACRKPVQQVQYINRSSVMHQAS